MVVLQVIELGRAFSLMCLRNETCIRVRVRERRKYQSRRIVFLFSRIYRHCRRRRLAEDGVKNFFCAQRRSKARMLENKKKSSSATRCA